MRKLRQKIFEGYFVSQSNAFVVPHHEPGEERSRRAPLRFGLLSTPGLGLFWGAPQKSPPDLIRPSALCPTTATRHPRHLSRNKRGVKDLGQSLEDRNLFDCCRASEAGDFFGGRKVPFLAPQKSQKSPRGNGAARGRALFAERVAGESERETGKTRPKLVRSTLRENPRLCGRGGIGRRAGLRVLFPLLGVKVRPLSSAF